MDDLTWTAGSATLGELVPWERNPKAISKHNAERLLDYWQRIGQFQTIAIGPGGEVYDGHQRLSVLKAAFGPSYRIDVRRASRALTEAEREELVIAAHAGTVGSWDWDALASWDTGELKAWGLDEATLHEWNDDAANLALMLEAEEEAPPEDPGPQIDRAEELREKWGVEAGQLWRLGEHRLICGDCTDADVVARVMGEEKARMVWTDPPYGVSYGAKNRYLQTIGRSDRLEDDIEGDDLSPDEIEDLATGALAALALHSLPGAVAYVAAPAGPLHIRFIQAMNESGFQYRHQLIWLKNQLVFGRSDYMYKHEPILYGWLQNGAHFFEPRSNNCTVFEFDRPRESKLHPTMKPVELVAAMIENSSNDGDIVAEPFCGSGTTLIACERLGRKCRAIEIEPKYIAVTLQRWADMTGGTPELIETMDVQPHEAPDFIDRNAAREIQYVPDAIFHSDNEWDVPTLLPELQADFLELPFTKWGDRARKRKMCGTYHFYTDDYKFEALWKDPLDLINSSCVAIVEPNTSTNDQMPTAVALWQIYRKRWLARYLQELGVKVWVDLNVDPKWARLNLLGVPQGWRSFCTRGLDRTIDDLQTEYDMACEVAAPDVPRFLVYGGGKATEALCKKRGWQWLPENMRVKEGKAEADYG